MVRPPARSLDVIAAQRSRPRSPAATAAAPTPAAPVAAASMAAAEDEGGARAADDSRSSSSASSPAPADNEESDFFLGGNDSQSSLGVPNLQDMQVSDEECLPPINRLPNEILISIFAKLAGQPSDLLRVMLTCKRWARNSVDILWHRPACTTWERHSSICQTLGTENPYFSYRDFIRRLNLAALADKVNDGSVLPLAVCNRVERLTLTNCKGLTDSGLIALVENSNHLSALDISGDDQITEASIYAIAENCPRLQGLNVSGCIKISTDSMVRLAQSCRFIKRLKLNDCAQLTDEAILAFAEHCPNILEIDLHQCVLIQNEPISALLAKGRSLRELRLANCELIDDSAFLSLPAHRTYEHLRILDLTSCTRLTDRAVERIIDVAPRLRNLVLAKCRNITDLSAFAISRLGKNLHYLHLGHCGNLTDEAVKRLVHSCNRIRYIDLGCCTHLTDDSVTRLATLPKLKRIGLVKCANITDESVYALAKANMRLRPRRDAEGNVIRGEHYSSSHSSLERVHLSYCTNLTLKSIIRLLNSCPRLTHLSLTGVQAFLRDDLEAFSRDAPGEFTEHQRQVFCVFSGQGVLGLRRYLNSEHDFAELRDPMPGEARNPRGHGIFAATVAAAMAVPPAHNLGGEGAFDDGEPDVVDDDEVLDDEMAIDAQPPAMAAPPVPPPPPRHPLIHSVFQQHVQYADLIGQGQPGTEPPGPHDYDGAADEDHTMDSPVSGPPASTASVAALGAQSYPMHDPSRSRQASGAGTIFAQAGPSTASVPGPAPGQHGTSPGPSNTTPTQQQEDYSGSA